MSERTMGPALEPDEFEKAQFERMLTQAMRRVEASEGFAERVMGRCAEGVVAASTQVPESGPGAPKMSGVKKVVVMRSPLATLSSRAWVGGAIAAMLVLGAVGGQELHQRHEREQAALATQQFEAGVRVTDQALAQTRAQLARAGVNLGD